MLAEIYGWFTGGFGTADVKDAKALLDELADDVLLRAARFFALFNTWTVPFAPVAESVLL